MIGLLSKNLDLFQTAGDEDVNTTLTVEQVEEDLLASVVKWLAGSPRVLYIVVLSPDRIKSMIIKIVFVVFPANPSQYDTFMEKGLVYREVAERMYEKRRIIQARKKRLANAVSIFYEKDRDFSIEGQSFLKQTV
jgi:hypothetical protein